ncbi:MAG: VCBS repeat-containing protein [Planctomycetes bacterium]|nr:VCBS repeat-containing protein [Planctomycetota bacterium]
MIGKKRFLALCVMFLTVFPFCLPSYAETWGKSYSGTDLGDVIQCVSIDQTEDGGYALCGEFKSDALVVKLDEHGEITWQKTFGGDVWDSADSIHQTLADDGYILCGKTHSFGRGGDVLVVKLDRDGNPEWSSAFGGDLEDSANDVRQTSDNGYIITGQANYGFRVGDDILVLKLDSAGDIDWEWVYDGVNAFSIRQTYPDKGYILCGTIPQDTYIDILVMKLNGNGEPEWQMAYGGPMIDECYSIGQTEDGGYILCGMTYSFGDAGDVLAIKLDDRGNVEWSKIYGGSHWEQGRSIQQTADGGYILCGQTQSFGTGGDVLILKLDARGDVIWQKTFGRTEIDRGWSIQQTDDEGYVLVGDTDYFSMDGDDTLVLKLNRYGKVPGLPGLAHLRGVNVDEDEPAISRYSVALTPRDPDLRHTRIEGLTDADHALAVVPSPRKADDLIVDPGSPHGIKVYYNNTGPWTSVYMGSPGEGRMVVGDLDGYAREDLVIVHWIFRFLGWGPFGELRFRFDTGLLANYNRSGWVQLPWTRLYRRLERGPTRMVVGDMDGNGYDDLIADLGGIYVNYNNSGSWTNIHSDSPGPGKMAVGDLDGDGKADLIADFGDHAGGVMVFYNNTGPWRSIASGSYDSGFGDGRRMVVGDVDGDGLDDVVADFGSYREGIKIFYNNSRTWTEISPGSYSDGFGEGGMVIGDMDGNGKNELIADFGAYGGGVSVFYNNVEPWSAVNRFSPGPYRMIVGDMDDSGRADLVVDYGAMGVNVFYNNAHPWTFVYDVSPGESGMIAGNLDGQ